LQKEAFYASEKAMISCEIDNTRCDKDVKEIKIKVMRMLSCSSQTNKSLYQSTQLIISQTFGGVRHGRKETRDLELDLKVFGDLERKVKKAYKKKATKPFLPEDVTIQSELLPTTKTQLINVSYMAEVHVYHSGVTWKSKVPPAVFPISIYSNHTAGKAKEQDQSAVPIPEDWKPHVYQVL
jgi:hypothetical protein